MHHKRALLLVADGSEEMEAVITSDILSRAQVQVTRASVATAGLTVHCANGVKLEADVTLNDVFAKAHEFDALVLPGGGKGSQTFTKDHHVQELIKSFASSGKQLVAAICAAPMAVRQAEVFAGARITCYPGCEKTLVDFYKYEPASNVVVDGNLITSRGPGTAFEFGLAVAEALHGKEAASKVAADVLLSA